LGFPRRYPRKKPSQSFSRRREEVSTKKLSWLVCSVILVLVLVAGCAPTAAPPAGETPAAAAPTGKTCEGVKIIFFPGGPPGGPFATVVYNGAVAAAADLGADVEYVFSDWDTTKMIDQFKEAMATNPDGIAIMGHPGDDAFGPLVDEAESKGIIVTSQNTLLPTIEDKYKSQGFGYVGQELYASGYLLGKEAARITGFGEGDLAMVWGLLAEPTRGERTKGVIDALEEAGMTVDEVEIDKATNADATAGTPVFTGYVSSHPDVKLICTDHGALTATQETYLTAAGKGPDDIYMIGFDVSPATLEGIRNGWTDLVLDQQPFLQGYLPIVQICLTKKYLFAGLHIDTGAGLISQENVEALAPLIEEQIR
jgi:simple sugar transport system substrate-binding protein